MSVKHLFVLMLALGGLEFGSVAAARCTNDTLHGTVATALTKTVSGARSSTMYMESWDGAGNLQYLETDSNGTTTSAPYFGTGTYSIAANCIATVYYDGDSAQPWTFYIDENGDGYSWVNTQNAGIVAAGQTELISSELLVNPDGTGGPCTAATLKGTLAFASEPTNGSLMTASAGFESYDGAGHLNYAQTDSTGTTTTNERGSGTYTITPACVASVYYDGATTPWIYFVAPNGSAFWWINNQNTGTISAGKETKVATTLLVH
jgi:hypothetical protein